MLGENPSAQLVKCNQPNCDGQEVFTGDQSGQPAFGLTTLPQALINQPDIAKVEKVETKPRHGFVSVGNGILNLLGFSLLGLVLLAGAFWLLPVVLEMEQIQKILKDSIQEVLDEQANTQPKQITSPTTQP